MIGIKPLLSAACLGIILAGCQGPSVFSPRLIKPQPLPNNTAAPVTPAPKAVQPVAVAPAPPATAPAYTVGSSPVLPTQPVQTFAIDNAPIEFAPQPIATEFVESEAAFGFQTPQPITFIEEPQASTELAILNAPVLESSAAPIISNAPPIIGQSTIAPQPIAPVYETVSLPAIDVTPAPITESIARPAARSSTLPVPKPISRPSAPQEPLPFAFASPTGVDSGASLGEGDDLLPATSQPLVIDAEALPPIGSIPAPKVVEYGDVL